MALLLETSRIGAQIVFPCVNDLVHDVGHFDVGWVGTGVKSNLCFSIHSKEVEGCPGNIYVLKISGRNI